MVNLYKTLKSLSLTALLMIVVMISPVSSLAANPCSTADGYLDTGIGIMDLSNDSPPSKGIGGSGLTGDDDEKGIGGTGVIGHDNGIGGTGQTAENSQLIFVTGTIHAFGSVCVNGIEIDYATDTPVSTDSNRNLKTSSLKVGQVVDIIAEKNIGNGMPKAKNIAIRFPLQGPVTKINPGGRLISVMGKPVHLDNLQAGKSIKLGDSVRVSGLQNTNGEIMATFIESMPKQTPARIAPSKTKIPSNITRLSVQGYVQGKTPDGRVTIEGQNFDLGVSGKDIEAGTRMIVSGRRQQNGIIRASGWVREKAALGARLSFGETKDSGRQKRNRGHGGNRDDDKEDHSGKGRGKRPDDNLKNNRIDNSGKGNGRDDRIEKPDNSGRGRKGRPDRGDRPERWGRPERPDNSGSGSSH